jgi:ABC-2 type transport system permease protein
VNGGSPTAAAAAAGAPLSLLVRVNLLSTWRKFTSLRHQSKLLVTLIGLFLVGYVALAFGLFHTGLRFINRFPGLGPLMVERLLFLLFAFLFALLLLSNLVIGYTNLFRNREAAYLLTAPVRVAVVFQWKLLESAVLASWAFVFLIAPLLAAYGLVNRVPWHFYPATCGLVLLFIVLPGVAGSGAAVLLARFLDRRAFQVATVVTVLTLLALLAFRFRPEAVTEEQLEVRVLAAIDRLLENTRFAHFPLLPSYWLSASVQNWAEGALTSAGFFALVLLSHVLFFGALAFTRLGGAFYDAASTVQSRGSVFARWEWFQRLETRRAAMAAELRRRWLDLAAHPEQAPAAALGFGPHDRPDDLLRRLGLAPDVRALIVKDLRVFWRDTTQWGQTVLLFGLLAVYIINLRHFTRQLDAPFWITLVSFLNLGACALNVATVTTRFVFPQFSLEGRRVWLVGLAPLGLVRVVRLKFWLASGAALLLTLSLTLTSCHLLKLEWTRTLYFALAITVMTFVLNAIAVGLGALYPNFRETNPSKIVSGFGGTFCLVLSFLYILGSVVTLAVGSPWGWRGDESEPGRAVTAWTVFILISALAGWLPLRLGLKRVAETEL